MFNNILFFYNENCNYSKILKKYLKKNSHNCSFIKNSDKVSKINRIIKKNYYFDYIFAFRSYHILRKNVLRKTKFVPINFHPGTPKYRGIGCINYALFENAREYGCTAHLINEKIDSGKIIDVIKFKIKRDMNLEVCLNKTHQLMFKQARKIIRELNTNKNPKIIETWIKKNKKIKWSKKIKKRKELDKFYEIKLGKEKIKIENKIKATYFKNYHPYIKVKNENFYLIKEKDLKKN